MYTLDSLGPHTSPLPDLARADRQATGAAAAAHPLAELIRPMLLRRPGAASATSGCWYYVSRAPPHARGHRTGGGLVRAFAGAVFLVCRDAGLSKATKQGQATMPQDRRSTGSCPSSCRCP
jgi:hypothetical protein